MKLSLQSVRDKIDDYHRQWFHKVEALCTAIGIVPSLPRRCGRHIHRSNVPGDTPSAYFKRTISIPLLDHLLSEINSRFSMQKKTAMVGMYLIPSLLVTLTMEDCSAILHELLELYQQDLPSPDCVESEIHSWWLKWQQHLSEHGSASLPQNLSDTLKSVNSMYPNTKALITILCTLPVTSCSAERSFSGLKRIKTPFRSSMGTERLTGLGLLHLHYDITVNIPAAIDEFARSHPRRMQLCNIMAD